MATKREEIEADVESRVKSILHGWSGVEPDTIDRKSSLKTRCGISDDLKPSLAPSWSRISLSHDGSKVSQQEAGKCNSVGDVIKLIMGKIPEEKP